MDRRRNPFGDIERVFDRLDEQFGQEMGDLGRQFAVDVEDAGDHFVVTADLPGFEKEDIEVELREMTLTISAERESETEDVDDRYVRRERRGESVRRSITLPEDVEAPDTSAEYRNGVLTVELPKAGDEDGTSIDVL